MANMLNIGVSALKANQTSLATTGNNIANANTAGYTRQRTVREEIFLDNLAANSTGSGVSVASIQRIYDEFAVQEIRNHTSTTSRLDIYLESAGNLDQIFGNADTGLSNSIGNFFSSLQSVAEDPTSIPARNLFISNANSMTDRIVNLQDKLETDQSSVTAEMESIAIRVNSLTASIAQLNVSLTQAANGVSGSQSNSLLDQRDEALRKLSGLIDLQTVNTDLNQVNVFVASGQSLVIGGSAVSMTVGAGTDDTSQRRVLLETNVGSVDITSRVTGGSLGGLLEFRDDVLGQTQSQLGQISLGLALSFNDQHQLGMTLENSLGGDFFVDFNDVTLANSRVFPSSENIAPANGVVNVYVEDLAELTTDEYEMVFPATSASEFSIINSRTGEELVNPAFGGSFPTVIEFDGLRLEMTSGSFNAGDRFLISPTRYSARSMDVAVSDSRSVALALPVSAEAIGSNRGTGEIAGVSMSATDTNIFTTAGEALAPPLSIVFTSSTTYDVLDVSDPIRPVQLVPPIRDQDFVPGLVNDLLPADNGITGVVSDGPDASRVIRNAVDGTFENGNSAQDFVINTTDLDTGEVTVANVSTALNDSAQTIADTLSLHSGINATASNWAQLSEISSASPIVVTLNGQIVSGVDANTLTDGINSDPTLSAAGITALSDGSIVTLFGSTGNDLQIDVGGASAADSLVITDRNGTDVLLAADGVAPATTANATIGGQVEVFLDEGVELFASAPGVFSTAPTPIATNLGFQISMRGTPSVGDRFSIDYNTNGFSDNRNAVNLSEIQTRRILNGGAQTITRSNGIMIESLGTVTAEARVNSEAALTLLKQAEETREAVSGVNLDEEAAKLIEFEQAYNAAAQVITIARSLFDTLLSSVG